jgi:hypothetical protein
VSPEAPKKTLRIKDLLHLCNCSWQIAPAFDKYYFSIKRWYRSNKPYDKVKLFFKGIKMNDKTSIEALGSEALKQAIEQIMIAFLEARQVPDKAQIVSALQATISALKSSDPCRSKL